jgi:hypothetical protein
MGLDLGQMHRWVLGELARHRPTAESMAALIDQCEAARTHPDWAKLRALPYARESKGVGSLYIGHDIRTPDAFTSSRFRLTVRWCADRLALTY